MLQCWNVRTDPELFELLEHASMPIRHGGSCAISDSKSARDTFGFTSAGLPLSSTPCTAKTFLARSIPTVIMLINFPFRGVDEMSEIPSWHLLPFAETSPQPRGGEVPFIH